jgi:hypothetical protein
MDTNEKDYPKDEVFKVATEVVAKKKRQLFTKEDVEDELGWLRVSSINPSDIARQMGMSPTLFANKRYQRQYKRFSNEELNRLDDIRTEIINTLLMWG